MALSITNEASRCLNCKNPRCVQGCPVGTKIPSVIQMFKENKIMEAGKILFENNPMSLICSMVCNHGAQCTGNCILGSKGNPVHFYEIEEFISDAYLDRMEINKPVEQKERVAIVGSGPAGITVAFKMAERGYRVTMFEQQTMIGGMLRYGIPEFRLPKTIIDRIQKKLLEAGVKIRVNTPIGASIHIDDLFRDGYKTIFIATGTWRPKSLGLVGETLPNVHYGLAYLSHPSSYQLGENVAIIGAGNVAVDVARTALRNGARHVSLYARSKRIAASDDEIEYAILDGCAVICGRQIQRISEDGPIFKVAKFDENDKVIGYEDEEEMIKADSTIIAISQGPKDKIVNTTYGLKSNEKGLLIVDENKMTTVPGVFAAGDVVHGSMTVVHAVADAKIAVEAMDRYIKENRDKE